MYVASAFARGSTVNHARAGGSEPLAPMAGPLTITAAYPDDIGAALNMPPHQYSVMTDHGRNGGEQFFIVVRGAAVEIVGRTVWVF